MRITTALLMSSSMLVAQEHTVQGVLLEVDRPRHVIVVSCEAIPGYMDAMVMSFSVRDEAELTSIVAGTPIRFRMVHMENGNYAEHLQKARRQL